LDEHVHKTIFEKDTGKILGAQIVGFDGVDKRCDILATAIRAGMTGFDLTELGAVLCASFSSAKDPVNMIGYVIENTIKGLVKNFIGMMWKTAPGRKCNSPGCKDTSRGGQRENRRFYQHTFGKFEGNIDKLDKSKPVYVLCRSGSEAILPAVC
jgi:hypothetical protein